MKCCVDVDCREAVPAHRLHDVKKHRCCQVRAEVDEHGKNHHRKTESLLVVFLQHSCTVPTSGKSHKMTADYTAVIRKINVSGLVADGGLIHLSDIVVGCSSINSSGAGTNMLTVLGAESRLVFVGPTKDRY